MVMKKYALLPFLLAIIYIFNSNVSKCQSVSFTTSSANPSVGDLLTFTNTSTGLLSPIYIWNYGEVCYPDTILPCLDENDTALTNQSRSHVYWYVGYFVVYLTAIDGNNIYSFRDTIFIKPLEHSSANCCDNLIPNPGFENFNFCVNYIWPNTMYTPLSGGAASDWFAPQGSPANQATPDYFYSNPCSPCLGCASPNWVPCNPEGNENGHNNSNAYAGVVTFSPGGIYREYIENKLLCPLIAGQYNISFWLNLPEKAGYAVSNMGAYFSNSLVLQAPTNPMPVTPQFVNNSIIISSHSGWTQVSGTFNALGGEQYIVIGNFANNANTTYTSVTPVTNCASSSVTSGGYYFIDDVSVTPVINSPTITPSSLTFCPGSSVTLTASNGTGYQWSTGASTQTISVSLAGTYIITVSNSTGCTASASVNISQLAAPLLSQSSVDASCSNSPDGSVTVTVNNGYGPYHYSWSNGATSNSTSNTNTISGVTSGVYTVTVTNSNGCSATITSNVGFANLAPPNPIIIGDCYACGGSHIYSVSNPLSSPYYYTWLIKRLGVTFTNGIGSSTSQITIPGNSPIQVYFTVTDGNGCSATSVFDVFPCCQGTQTSLGILDITDIKASDVLSQVGIGQLYHNYVNNTGATPWFYTNYGSGSPTWDVVSINGTFTIDKNFQFAHAEIIMGPCAKIIILPGKTLSLTDNLYFHGCGERMWDQIYISDHTATLKMIAANVRMEDGEQAIVSHDGGVFTIGNTNIDFNKNWKSIVVQSYPNTHMGTVRDATFNCVKWPNNPNTVASLIRPHLGEKSYVGIEINNVDNILIGELNFMGSTNYPGFENKFYNLQNGIQAFGSGVTVINSEFNQIDGLVSTCKGCPVRGWAIYADGLNLGTPPLLKIGDVNYPYAANYFYNCNGGVSIRNDLNAIIQKNHFTNIIPQPGSTTNYPVI
jgi:hypothetical protein